MVLWFDIKYIQTHKHTHKKKTQHTQGPVDYTPIYIYIYTNYYVLTAAVFITLNEKFTGTKNLLSTMSFVFKNYSLVSHAPVG